MFIYNEYYWIIGSVEGGKRLEDQQKYLLDESFSEKSVGSKVYTSDAVFHNFVGTYLNCCTSSASFTRREQQILITGGGRTRKIATISFNFRSQ